MGRAVFHTEPGLEVGLLFNDGNSRVTDAYAENTTNRSYLVTVWLTGTANPVSRTIGPGSTLQPIPANRITRSVDAEGEAQWTGLDRYTVQGV